jgi:hypothetical protein
MSNSIVVTSYGIHQTNHSRRFPPRRIRVLSWPTDQTALGLLVDHYRDELRLQAGKGSHTFSTLSEYAFTVMVIHHQEIVYRAQPKTHSYIPPTHLGRILGLGCDVGFSASA